MSQPARTPRPRFHILKNLRHRWARRRLVGKLARKLGASRTLAEGFAHWTP